MVRSNKKNSTEPTEFNIKGYPEGKYPSFDAIMDKPMNKSQFEKDKKRRDFISQYVKDHNQDPGPKYNIIPDMTKMSLTLKNSPRLIFNKNKIPTIIHELASASKKNPGVGLYNIAKPQRILGTYDNKDKGGTFTDVAVFNGMATPGHYPAIDLDKIKNRTLMTNIANISEKNQ